MQRWMCWDGLDGEPRRDFTWAHLMADMRGGSSASEMTDDAEGSRPRSREPLAAQLRRPAGALVEASASVSALALAPMTAAAAASPIDVHSTVHDVVQRLQLDLKRRIDDAHCTIGVALGSAGRSCSDLPLELAGLRDSVHSYLQEDCFYTRKGARNNICMYA